MTRKRFLSVFLPNWSVDLFQRHNSKESADTLNRELLFAVDYAGEKLVARCCTKSRKAGVSVGMKLANALSRTTDALVTPFEFDKEQNALYRLAQWAYKFSPLTTPDRPLEIAPITDLRFDGINLDIAGCEKLFKGEARLVQSLCSELAELGLSFRVAAAPTLGSAWAFARYGEKQISIIENEELYKPLAEFPVSALRIPARIKQGLSDLNIRYIGELHRLPRKALLARFDPILLERLDQALGKRDELIEPVKFNLISRVHKAFDGPTTQLEAVTKTAAILLQELLEKLEGRAQKLAKLRLELNRVDAPNLIKDISLSVATSRFEHIWALIRPKIDNFDLGYGVDEVTLTALQTEDTIPRKTSYTGLPEQNTGLSKELGELLDTLNEELGSKRLLKLECFESHFPERAFSYESLLSKLKEIRPTATSALIDADRPTVLLSAPLPIQAMALLPDSPPFWIKWDKRSFNLERGIGPERIAPQWWGRDEKLFKTRDYFKVQLKTGLWLWVYRELESAQWYLHGVWA